MIEEMRDHYSVTELCEALEVSRAGYYKSKSLPPSAHQEENEQIIETMKQIWTPSIPVGPTHR